MSLFSREHSMPSWVECAGMLAAGLLGAVVCLHRLFRHPVQSTLGQWLPEAYQ